MAVLNGQAFELESFLNTLFIRYKKESLRKGVELSINDDLASFIWIVGEPQKLQALMELVLQNTFDHSRASRVTFSTKQLLRTDSEILLEFVLEDNGPSARRSRTMNYYRGLVKARRMIEALQGKSEIVSSPGHGMSVKFIIKCQWTAPEERMESMKGTSIANLQHRRVLVVEDNEINQRSITQILDREGVISTVAANGKEAVETLEKESFDLVLMDLQMPVMDGVQASNYIRKILKSPVPIVGMTSGSGSEDVLRCLHSGMNQFIRKPFMPSELLTQLCSFFEPVYLTIVREEGAMGTVSLVRS